ncbi:MAG: undecaprenyl-diphosphate phosphatase [Rickettsiales bacterium]|jgi:undecaprenyl-diphosphatase|nr:undecaprenyl-diphosphate phosphatase [Rickettsiales bacterium]
MTSEYLVLLSFIQGFAEFLPISSSAHLALIPALASVADQGRFIDVAAHVGSLLAVMWRYRRRVRALLTFEDMGLAWRLTLSFIPMLMLGLFIDPPRAPMIIAVNMIVFGALLWAADRFGKKDRDVSPGTAFLAGLAQVMALIPGVSRSGVTISMMRARGVDRPKALDFAFLMSMPAIAAAGAWELLGALRAAEAVDWTAAITTVASSFVFSLIAIKFMMHFVRRFSFLPFAIYRVALGIVILYMLF